MQMMSQKANAMSDQTLLESHELNILGYLPEAESLAKSAWTLNQWIDESTLREIEGELGVAPGDLRVRVDHADWLINAARQICANDDETDPVLLDADVELIEILDIMRKRIPNGCKEDLLSLISIRGVGRIRARTLANHGYRTLWKSAELQKMLHKNWRMSEDGVRSWFKISCRRLNGQYRRRDDCRPIDEGVPSP
ncbi:MAG: hypothetical protein Ct9H90mP16_07950 [Candidatus Poseidoniales archaeon]|nr:MAG: hypothetical protein Ct9H90mP16_07950 [Candidatus Poseidoniales archaeon]